MTETLLVTGASGYIASHVIKQALEAGYRVRGTARNAQKAAKVLEALGHPELEIIQADLASDAGWDEAMQGVDYVAHVASPFPDAPPAHEDDLVRPAREGARRVMQAASKAGVKRVVLTSSMAAISSGYGKAGHNKNYDESSWSNVDGKIAAYDKSKTLAERAAWEIAEEAGVELVVINPGLVIGPLVAPNAGTSLEIPIRLLKGSMPGVPRVGFGYVDVRDVAAAHLAALKAPNAAGNRYLCVSHFGWFEDMAQLLKQTMGDKAKKVPTRKIPDFVIKIAALFDPAMKLVSPSLGVRHHFDNSAIKRDLGFEPISAEDSWRDTGESLIKFGVV